MSHTVSRVARDKKPVEETIHEPLPCQSYVFVLRHGLYSLKLAAPEARTPGFAAAFLPPGTTAAAPGSGFIGLDNAQAAVLAPGEDPLVLRIAGNDVTLYVNEFSPANAVAMDRCVVIKLLDPDAGLPQTPVSHAPGSPGAAVPEEPPAGVDVSVTAHREGRGETVVTRGSWTGNRSDGSRLEGFSASLTGETKGLELEYLVGNTALGLTPWIKQGRYCGTRGKGVPITKMAVRLVGAEADKYDVRYQGNFVSAGDGPMFRNGEICQSAENEPLAAFRIEIVPATGRPPAEKREPDLLDFDEQEYLRVHPDVATAVALGDFRSGYQHYVDHGRAEGRSAPRRR